MVDNDEPDVFRLESIAATIEEPETVKPQTPGDDVDGGGPDVDGPRTDLPPGCPVTPLGCEGTTFFYLDAKGQIIGIPSDRHSKNNMVALLSPQTGWAHQNYTRYSKEGKPNGWHADRLAEHLMNACSDLPIWNPLNDVRGAGAWRGERGELILHCGNAVLIDDEWIPPGRHGRHVYPASRPLPRPASMAFSGPDTAGQRLKDLLATWNWRRGELDAHLLLGFVGAGMIGGALKTRPLLWITGTKGTGKSAIHDVLKLVFDDAIVSVSDATAAGVWQKLGFSTLPVAVDEIEAQADNRKELAVVQLARQAFSGGLVLRGGQDHKGAEFVARSAFLFSSIIIPPLLGQDRSRMAILELEKLRAVEPLSYDPDNLRAVGGAIRRRLVDGWPRLDANFEVFRQALADEGHDARAADVFGTLLACADLILADGEVDRDSAISWAMELGTANLADFTDDESDEGRCATHLLSKEIDPYHNGTKTTVARWILRAQGRLRDEDADKANRALGNHGLKVTKVGELEVVAIANYHDGLARLFDGSHWTGRSGSMGGWVQALRRLPGAERADKTVYFAGVRSRATIVPAAVLVPEGAEHETAIGRLDDRGPDPGPDWGEQ